MDLACDEGVACCATVLHCSRRSLGRMAYRGKPYVRVMRVAGPATIRAMSRRETSANRTRNDQYQFGTWPGSGCRVAARVVLVGQVGGPWRNNAF